MSIATSPLRIAIISASLPPASVGGIARWFGDLAPTLHAQGHDVRIITAHSPATVTMAHTYRVPATPTRHLLPEAFPHLNNFASGVVDVLDSWEREGWIPNVVYGPAFDAETLGVLRATRHRVVSMLATPLAVTAELTGHLALDSHSAAFERMRMLEAEVFTRSHRIHALSHCIVDTINNLYPVVLSAPRTQIIPLGLADMKFNARKRDRDPHIMFVGRLEKRKGIDTLLEALPRVLSEVKNAWVTIAGPEVPHVGQEMSFEKEFHLMHGTKVWSGRVAFVGQLSEKKLQRLYEFANIGVFPSRYESFGLVAVEAMRAGMAAVGTSGTGLAEVIAHESTGLVIPPDDVDALAGALIRLCHVDRHAFGRLGREDYERSFTIQLSAERVANLLCEVAKV